MIRHRYVAAFFGKRDYYQAAVALADADRLARLLTDFYYPDGLARFGAIVPGNLGEKISSRRADGLPSRLVRSPVRLVGLRREATRLLGRDMVAFHRRTDAALGRAAAETVNGRDLGALVYGFHWPGFISDVDLAAPRRGPYILFQAHPLSGQAKGVLERDRLQTGISIDRDGDELASEETSARYEALASKADGIIVASTFTKRGFEELGYPSERTKVVPYGGDFSVRPHWNARAGTGISAVASHTADLDHVPLKLLWVGQLAYRKGPHHLFEALRRLPPEAVQLTMVCRSRPAAALLRDLPPNVTLVRDAATQDLERIYSEHDVFVMPSLVEGFGLVYLEAMNAGLPIICTPNTGGPDIAEDGVDGIIVPAGDPTALTDAIWRLTNDRELVERMAQRAAQRARRWTWQRFRQQLQRAVEEIESVGRR